MKSEQRKERMDPLKDMKHYVKAKRKCMEETEDKPLRVEVRGYNHSRASFLGFGAFVAYSKFCIATSVNLVLQSGGS